MNTNSWTCHAEKQFQKRNGKAATWEKSSVGGRACFCDAEGQKGFLHLQRKPARKQKSTGMSIFAMRMKSERKARNRKKVQLIERKRLKRGIEGGERLRHQRPRCLNTGSFAEASFSWPELGKTSIGSHFWEGCPHLGDVSMLKVGCVFWIATKQTETSWQAGEAIGKLGYSRLWELERSSLV